MNNHAVCGLPRNPARRLRPQLAWAALPCLALAAVAFPAWADVKLEAAQRESLGIETARLAPADAVRSLHAVAQVLDSAPLIALLSELQAADAAVSGSRSEAQRAQQLYSADNNVSLKALEAARAQAAGDVARAQGLRSQLLANWGRALQRMSEADRARLVADLSSGRTALLRAESTEPATAGAQLQTASLQALTGDERWAAQVLGPAAQAATAGVGSTYLMRAQIELPPGTVLQAQLHDRSRVLRGIKIPRAAIVRWQGEDWVYLEEQANSFTRHLLQPVEWLDDGCLVQAGFSAGQQVVTAGARWLLAAENSAPEAA